MKNLSAMAAISLLFTLPVMADDEVNYDESKVPRFSLPDPLFFADGKRVVNPKQWQKRRGEILSLFEDHMYGQTPAKWGAKEPLIVDSIESTEFLNCKATLHQVRLQLIEHPKSPMLDLMLVIPKQRPREGKSPAFLTVNFRGNHTVHPSPKIRLSDSWVQEGKKEREQGLIIDNRSTEKSRGIRAKRWAIEKIIDSGIAFATWYYADVDPDFDDGFENGIHAAFGKPGGKEWGSIGSWAWGFSRAMDYLETRDDINSSEVAVMGHSRLGKTALWAGAQDQRFALVISNNSGCGGAALSRRRFGEKVTRINTNFPHWFSDAFTQYNDRENELPIDQHMLISLIAPRPVYIASAVDDRWADPKGEFLSGLHADPVYRLLGTDGIGSTTEHPEVDQSIGKTIRYHMRKGGHGVTDYDWEQYIRAMQELVIGNF